MLKNILENLLIIYLILLAVFAFIVPMICSTENMGARDILLATIFYPLWFLPLMLFLIATIIHAVWTIYKIIRRKGEIICFIFQTMNTNK